MLKYILQIKSKLPTYFCSAVKRLPTKQSHTYLIYFIELKLKPQRPVHQIMVLHHGTISPVPDVVALTLAASIYLKPRAQSCQAGVLLDLSGSKNQITYSLRKT